MLNDSRKTIVTRNPNSLTRLEFIRRQLAKDDIRLSLSAVARIVNGDNTIMPVTITNRIRKLSTQEPFVQELEMSTVHGTYLAYIVAFLMLVGYIWYYYDIVVKHKFEFKFDFDLTFPSKRAIVNEQNKGTAQAKSGGR